MRRRPPQRPVDGDGWECQDAFASAELLAEAINQGLVGQRPLDGALSDYQNNRDALTANGYALSLSTARLAPLTPRLEAFYGAAADQPDVVRRIFGVIGGSLPTGMLLEGGAG